MDETLRRRLVGAAVLLGIAFLVASLLPEPAPRSVAPASRVVTYDLRTGQAVRATEVPVEEPPVEEMPPEAATPESAPPAQEPAAPRPTLKVDESLGAHAGAWYLQIGSFESQTNARNVLQKLYGAGLPTTIQSLSVGKKLWYRVRVGPYADEAAAQQALATVRKQGYPLAKVVRPEAPAPERN
jgi:cell division septation protein DedD